MIDPSTIPTILNIGTIGLGFLLAVLTYYLIRGQQPYLIFMGFSIVLVVVGGFLQYTNNIDKENLSQKTESYNEIKAQFDEQKQTLQTAQQQLSDTKDKLTTAVNNDAVNSNNLTSATEKLTDDERSLADLRQQLSDAQARASNLQISLSSSQSDMTALQHSYDAKAVQIKNVVKLISSAANSSIGPLGQANGLVTDGGACPGDGHGIAMPHGNQASGLIQAVVNNVGSIQSAIAGLNQ